MNSFGRIFARGLFSLIPIVLTIYIVYQVVAIFEGLVGAGLRALLPNWSYVPGVGFLASLLLIYLLGLILNHYLAQQIVSFFERQLLRLPLLKTIYSPLRDLVQLFSKKDQRMGRPVFVQVGDEKALALGFVTCEDFSDLKLGVDLTGQISVYFPMSYMIGGYILILPKEKVKAIDLPIEKAMSLAITGWIRNSSKEEGAL